MPTYGFEALSGYEFEQLARDLLQAELGVRFESFAPGPDGGMDARYLARGARHPSVVVQCKQYQASGFSALLASLRREAVKAQRLTTERYVLVTSVPLTAGRKDRILACIGRTGMAPRDVIGREDLNNLLGLHPEVEARHPKLWLAGTAALARHYAAPAVLDTGAAVDRMRERMRRYVPNPSFTAALSLLQEHRFCLIVGEPGIGKTTLAEALLVHHADRGFEAVRITNRLSEIKGIANASREQIFYYDDFLGDTGLRTSEHNEERQLVEFLDLVSRTQRWRFILTSRDYILHAAQSRSEVLAHFPFDTSTRAIRAEEHTRLIRGQILYNHIYFSDLPSKAKLELLAPAAHQLIVSHRNYNPRLVEHMTDARRLGRVSPGGYLPAFLAALDDPSRIWEHAYRNHLSAAGRHLLLTLFVAEARPYHERVRQDFEEIHTGICTQFGLERRPYDFETALKELTGSFISLPDRWGYWNQAFQNPSVRDFLERHLDSTPAEANALLDAVGQSAQILRLWNGCRGRKFRAFTTEPMRILRRTDEILTSEWRVEAGWRARGQAIYGVQAEAPGARLHLALGIRGTTPCTEANRLLRRAVKSLVEAIRFAGGDVPKEDAAASVALLRPAEFRSGFSRRLLRRSVGQFLVGGIGDLYSAEMAMDHLDRYGGWESNREEVRKRFRTAAEWHIEEVERENLCAVDVRHGIPRLTELAIRAGVDPSSALERLESLAAEREQSEGRRSGPMNIHSPTVVASDWPTDQQALAELERSFASLRAAVEDSLNTGVQAPT